MTSIANHLLNFPIPLAITFVFLLPALESSIFLGFIFPGETAVVIGGVLASQHKVSVFVMMAAAAVGAVLGDSAGYFVGRRWGHSLLERAGGRLLKPSRIQQAMRFVSRWGAAGVIVGRFTTVLRVLVPGVSGMAEMPYPRFLVANVIGGVGWAITYTLIGYAAGASFAKVEKTAGTIGLIVVGVIVVVLVLIGLVRYLREFRKERPVSTGE